MVPVAASCLGLFCLAAGARNLLQPTINWPFALTEIAVAILLLLMAVAALWPPRVGAAKNAIVIFLALVAAGLTWAGVLRFRQSGPPGASQLSVTTAPSPHGFGRFLLYGAQMLTAWWKRRFER